MFAELLRHPTALLYSIIAHVAVLALVVFGLQRPPVAVRQPASPEPVKAITVDEERLNQALQQLEKAEQRKQQEALQAQQALEEQLQAREREQKRLAELKRQAAKEEQRRRAEVARLEKLKKQQAQLEERRRKEKQELAALEAKRKAEAQARKKAEAEARQRAEEEARKQANAARQRKAQEEARRKAEAEARREAELAAAVKREKEQRRLVQERRRLQSLQAQWAIAIQQKVQRNWLRPPSATRDMFCDVLVNQIPSGDVTSVEVLQCRGGDSVFRRSVELAVLKASPLPSPPDPAVFERQIQFTFRPEN